MRLLSSDPRLWWLAKLPQSMSGGYAQYNHHNQHRGSNVVDTGLSTNKEGVVQWKSLFTYLPHYTIVSYHVHTSPNANSCFIWNQRTVSSSAIEVNLELHLRLANRLPTAIRLSFSVMLCSNIVLWCYCYSFIYTVSGYTLRDCIQYIKVTLRWNWFSSGSFCISTPWGITDCKKRKGTCFGSISCSLL